MKQIGIDLAKEGEVYELGPEGDFRIYGGWFYFTGEIVKPGERNSILPGFEFWFVDAKRLPKPVVEFGANVAAVEFITKARWVLTDRPEPA